MTTIDNEIAITRHDAWRYIGEAAPMGPQGMLPLADGMLHAVLPGHVLTHSGGDEHFAAYQQRGAAIGRLANTPWRGAADVDRLTVACATLCAYAVVADSKHTPAYDAAHSALIDALAACIGG